MTSIHQSVEWEWELGHNPSIVKDIFVYKEHGQRKKGSLHPSPAQSLNMIVYLNDLNGDENWPCVNNWLKLKCMTRYELN